METSTVTRSDKRQAVGRQPQRGQYAEHDDAQIGAEHVHLAVGEVDELEDAVDHGVPQRDECIHRAEGKAVYELLGEHGLE